MPHQVSVFLENRPGRLGQVTGVLAQIGVNIRAMTLASSSAGWGVLNLLVDQPEKACRALCASGLSAVLREIVAVEMKDQPGGLHDVLAHLAGQGINIENAYGTVLREGNSAILIIDVGNIPRAMELLGMAELPSRSTVP